MEGERALEGRGGFLGHERDAELHGPDQAHALAIEQMVVAPQLLPKPLGFSADAVHDRHLDFGVEMPLVVRSEAGRNVEDGGARDPRMHAGVMGHCLLGEDF